MPDDVTIRIYFDTDGRPEDGRQDFSPSDFAGEVPQPGDLILNPGVRQGLDRLDPVNRRFWLVKRRVFNPRDNANYVGLVVEEVPCAPGLEDFT